MRKPDEILPADAASGAGRTPAGRSAVLEGLWTHQCSTLTPLSYLYSPTGRQVAVVPESSDARSLCDLLNLGLDARRGGLWLMSESAREHVRNALEMLTNCGDDKYLIGNKRRVVYDAGDIEAVKARLLKALGL